MRNRDGIFELKRKWVPLFLFGIALFGSGIALVLLWLYRSSPYPRYVVDFLTTSDPATLPPGTLIRLTAVFFAAIGGWILAYSIRKINESEVGEIDSFWWKLAVASFAGQWWLGQPRVAVIGSGAGLPPLLRALKTFCGAITVVGTAQADTVIALADNEEAVQKVLPQLTLSNESADGLRLHGRFIASDSPIAFDMVTHAEAVLIVPDLESVDLGLRLSDYVSQTRGKKILVGPVTAAAADILAQAVQRCAAQVGSLTVLANNNFVSQLPAHRFYQKIEGAVQRDLADWTAPENWDVSKLAVFLREVISTTHH